MNLTLLRLTLLSAIGCQATSQAQTDWVQYLGPNRNGASPEVLNETKWPTNGLPAVKWQTRAGTGIASPVIKDGWLYTIGAVKPEAIVSDGVSLAEMWTESELGTTLPTSSPYFTQVQEYLAGFTNPQTNPPYHPVITYAFCFNAETGALRWAQAVSGIEEAYKYSDGMNLPRAAPLLHQGRLYTQTQCGTLTCLEAATGTLLWQKTIQQLGSSETPHFAKVGVGGAPFALGDDVCFTYPMTNNTSAVTRFSGASGAVLWTRNLNTGFRVPLLSASLATLEGLPTIVVPGGYITYGLNPATGAERWSFNAHTAWPEISFDPAFHSPTNCVYWQDQHPGRIPVIWQDYIVNRVFIWGGHKDQRTYCLRIQGGQPQLVWFKKTLSAWRGLYINKENLLLAMDYNHYTTAVPLPASMACREHAQYDEARYQCIDIPTGNLLWGTDAFTVSTDARQLSYNYFEPEHIAVGNHVIVMHQSRLGYGAFDASGITIKTVDTTKNYWGFSPLVFCNGLLYFQRMAAVNGEANSYGGQQDNLFCLDLRTPTYGSWRQTHFTPEERLEPSVSGHLADPNHDGIGNLLSYALNVSPVGASGISGLPVADLSVNRLALTFTRLRDATDVTYRVFASDDLSAWTPIWSSATNPYPSTAPSILQSVEDTAEINAGTPRRFLRLQITAP